ncbi:MAG: FecR domain-containing protein [Longimicrobiaceae bacterium]
MSQENRDAAADGDAVYTAMARAMAGEGAPAEREAFRRALDADPVRAALYAALDDSLRPLSADAAPGVDVEAALARVLARRDQRPVLVAAPERARGPRLVPSATRAPRWRPAPFLRAAAVILLLAGGVLVWRTLSRRSSAGPAVAYTTEVGGRRTVDLPDGSVAQLAPLSRIEVAPGYGQAERAVALTGEAYFEVRHDAAHPFVVRTAAAEVRDLGTAFSVAEGGSSGARVVVTEGSVSLRAAAGGDTVVLRAGDRGSVSAAGEVRVERGTAGEDDVAWTRGRLVFRDAPIPEVAEALRRWYGITLVVRDPELARRHLTASFGTETADEAVRVVAAALGGQLQRRGDTAAVVPPGGSP